MQSTVCLPMPESCFSKSNMAVSTVPVGGIEVILHVTADAVLKGGEAGVVACSKQAFDVCLSEVLILLADILGHRRVNKCRLAAEHAKQRDDQVAETARLA